MRHTSVGVQLGVVQVLNDLLDGRDRPVPRIGEMQWLALGLGTRAGKSGGKGDQKKTHIFQLPPTKNLRAILKNWGLKSLGIGGIAAGV